MTSWPLGGSEMASRICAFNWASTPLGPIAAWPQTLRTAVDLMLASAQPVYIGWGPDLISLYNDGYIPIVGDKFSASLGLPYRLMWPEIWEEFRPVAEAVMAGEAQYFEDQPVPLAGRPGRPMSWFTFSWTPLRNEVGAVVGFYCAAVETTHRVLAEQERDRNYRALVETMDEGYLLADVIFDETGKAVDIAYVDANPAATRMVGTDLKGRRLRDVSPDYEDYWYEIWGRVARTGIGERLERYARPENRWYNFYVFKPASAETDSNQVAVLFHDATKRKELEDALRDNEEQQAFFLKLSDTLRPLTDPAEITTQATRILGEYMEADRTFIAVMKPDGIELDVDHEYLRPGASSVIGHHNFDQFGTFVGPQLAAGHVMAVEDVSSLKLTQTERAHYAAIGIMAYLLVPLVRHGRFAACFACNHQTPRPWSGADRNVVRQTADRTWAALERARAEAALRDSEGRLRTLIEGVPQLIWRSTAEGLWTWASPQWLDYTGQSQEASHGGGWLDAVHPDDRAGAEQAWQEARPDGRLDVEYRVRRAADGAWRWHQTRSVPERQAHVGNDPEGPIAEWLGTTTDIDDLKRLQAQQQVMVAELQHRTRNLLAVVRNVARRSVPASPGRDIYDARLAALGRVQGFLSRSTAYSVPLADLVEAELHAAGDGASDKVEVSGPPIALPGESVQAVALALHELATNAVKYGAIAQPSGRLSVTWRIEDGSSDGARLVIDWRESGVAMPAGPPARRGYGIELITRALPYQLRAETLLEFKDDGVQCRIALPASAFSAVQAEQQA